MFAAGNEKILSSKSGLSAGAQIFLSKRKLSARVPRRRQVCNLLVSTQSNRSARLTVIGRSCSGSHAASCRLKVIEV